MYLNHDIESESTVRYEYPSNHAHNLNLAQSSVNSRPRTSSHVEHAHFIVPLFPFNSHSSSFSKTRIIPTSHQTFAQRVTQYNSRRSIVMLILLDIPFLSYGFQNSFVFFFWFLKLDLSQRLLLKLPPHYDFAAPSSTCSADILRMSFSFLLRLRSTIVTPSELDHIRQALSAPLL
jgi:hypothetical protein